jgi:tape measure domain-containing protein
MAAELGVGYVSVVPSARGFSSKIQQELNGIEPEFAKIGDKGGKSFSSKFASAAGTALKRGGLAAGAAGGAAIAAGVTKGIGRLNSIEQAEAKLKGLGNSGQQVGDIMSDALASVKGTSFGLEEAATTAATMVAAGIKPGKELEGVLTTVGDTATIAGSSMADMGTIFSSVAARGKLQGDDLLQLLSRGVPVLQLLADETGKTSGEISDMVSKGEIDFETFSNAMKRGMGGAALEAGNTAQGALKNVGAAAGRLGATLAGPFFDQAAGAFTGVTSALDDMNDRMGPAMDDFSSWLQGNGIPAVKDFASETVESFRSLAENPAVVSAFDSTKLAIRNVVDAGKALAPVALDMASSLSKAAGAVGISTWDLLATALGAAATVADSLAGPLQTVADIMAAHPAIVTAAVAAWAGFKTIPGMISKVATGISGVTGASKALSGVSGPMEKITTALSPIGEKAKLVGGSMQEAAAQTRAFAAQHPEMSKMGVAVQALGNNVPIIGKMGASYKSAAAGLKAYSAQQKIMSATALGAAERSKDLFLTVDRIGAGAFRSATGSVASFAGTLRGVGAAAMTGFRGAASGLMTMMGGPWGAALIAAAGAAMFVADSLQKMKEQQRLSAELAKTGEVAYRDMFDTLVDGGDKIESSTKQVSKLRENLSDLGKTDHGGVFRFIDEMGVKVNSLKGIVDPLSKAQAEQVKNQLDTADSAEKAAAKLDELGMSDEDVARKVNASTGEFAGFTAKLRESGEGGKELANHLEEMRLANEKAQESFEKLGPQAANAAKVIEDLGGKAQTSADDVMALHDAIYGLGDGADDAGEAAGKLTEEIDKAANSAKDFGEVTLDASGHIDQTTTSGREFYKSLKEVADGYVGSVAAGNSARDEWLRVKDTFYALGESAGFSQEQTDELLRTMGYMPDQVKTTVEVAGDTAKSELLEIGQQLSDFDGSGPFTADVKVSDKEARDAIENAGFKLSEFDESTGMAKLEVADEDAAARFEWWTTHGFPEFDAANPTAKANLDTTNLEFSAQYAQMQVDTLDMKRPNPVADMDTNLLSDKQVDALNRLGFLDGRTPTPKADMNLDQLEYNEQVALAKIFDLSQEEATPLAKLLGIEDFATDSEKVRQDLANIPSEKRVTIYQDVVGGDWSGAYGPGGRMTDSSGTAVGQKYAAGGRIPKSAAGRLIGARGGYKLPTSGPGTDRTDGILGVGEDGTPTSWVDAGEWVINAKSAEKYHDLLAAINADDPDEIQQEASSLPALAGGGPLGGLGGGADLSMGMDLTGALADDEAGGPFASVTQSFSDMATSMATMGTDLVNPALMGMQDGVTNLGTGFMTTLQTMIQPALTGMGTALTAVKTGVVDPAFAGIRGGLNLLGQTFLSGVQGVINPTWQGMGATVMGVKTGTVDPAFAGIQGGIAAVEQSFATGTAGANAHFSTIGPGTADPARYAIGSVFNGGIVQMWNSAADYLGTSKMAPAPMAFATGGHVRGPGGPTEDKIPALLSDGEFVVKAKAVDKIGVKNLNAINDGHPVAAEAWKSDLPALMATDKTWNEIASRYNQGGPAKGSSAWKQIKRGMDWARSLDGRPYVLGGDPVAGGGTDCSGYQSSVADRIGGGPGHRAWGTMAFNGGGNSQHESGPQGFVKGLAAGHAIGVLNGGPADGHTAGTIGGLDGLPATNIESGGSHGNVAFGGPAVGADNAQFPTQYHLPLVGDRFVSGGGGGPSISQLVGAAIGPGQQAMSAAVAAWGNPAGMVNEWPPKTSSSLGEMTLKKIQELAAEKDAKEGKAAGVDLGGLHGDTQQVAKEVFARHGMSGQEWSDAAWIIGKESGWDTGATNPSSGAYGLGQLNPSSGTLQHYDPGKSSDAGTQADATARYIKDTYGTAGAARAHWEANGWYDEGGYLEPGVTRVHNETMKPEPVFTSPQWQTLRASVSNTAALVPAVQKWVDNGLDELERIANATSQGWREWSEENEDHGRLGSPEEIAAHYGGQAAKEFAGDALSLVGLDGLANVTFSDAFVDLVNAASDTIDQQFGVRLGHIGRDSMQPQSVLDDDLRHAKTPKEDETPSVAAEDDSEADVDAPDSVEAESLSVDADDVTVSPESLDVPESELADSPGVESLDAPEPDAAALGAPEPTVGAALEDASSDATSMATAPVSSESSQTVNITLDGDAFTAERVEELCRGIADHVDGLDIRVDRLEAAQTASVTAGVAMLA